MHFTSMFVYASTLLAGMAVASPVDMEKRAVGPCKFDFRSGYTLVLGGEVHFR